MILWDSGAPIYFPLLWLLLLTTRIFLEIASWVSWKQNFTLSLSLWKVFSETLVTSWFEIHPKIHQIGGWYFGAKKTTSKKTKRKRSLGFPANWQTPPVMQFQNMRSFLYCLEKWRHQCFWPEVLVHQIFGEYVPTTSTTTHVLASCQMSHKKIPALLSMKHRLLTDGILISWFMK